jgi:hypothetical protein
MSNPTSNFGWQMPTATDLVTDLPADFEVFGQAVDSSMADLKGGTSGQVLSKNSNTDMDFVWVTSDDANAIQNTIVDAKGDLIGATAADTPARLAVGTNGQVLTADSTAATGLAWSTISAGGMTLLSTTALSGASTTVSSISGSYNQLYIQVLDSYASSNGSWYFRVNGDSTAAAYQQLWSEAASNVVYASATPQYYETSTKFQWPATVAGSDKNSAVEILFSNYADTTSRKMMSSVLCTENGGGNQTYNPNNGFWNNASAITSFTFGTNGGTWTQGSIKIWGIK